MDFPFGHHRHRHHPHAPGEEEEDARRREEPHYPPPGRRGEPYYPPPGHQPDAYGSRGGEDYQRPLPRHGGGERGFDGWDAYQGPPGHAGYEPGAGYPAVQQVAHEVRPGPQAREEGEGGWYEERHHHGHHGGPFSFVNHVSHESSGSGGVPPPANLRTVRIFTKAAENYSLSIRDGKVILARADHRDEYQHWIKNEKFSTKVKDEEGLPSFALVNKITGEAIKHSIGPTHPVRLIPYNANYLDESILWTESHDTGEGFRCIRMVNNIRLNFDAFHGDEDHGGVHDGTIVVLWEWLKGKNQRWKIVPY